MKTTICALVPSQLQNLHRAKLGNIFHVFCIYLGKNLLFHFASQITIYIWWFQFQAKLRLPKSLMHTREPHPFPPPSGLPLTIPKSSNSFHSTIPSSFVFNCGNATTKWRKGLQRKYHSQSIKITFNCFIFLFLKKNIEFL